VDDPHLAGLPDAAPSAAPNDNRACWSRYSDGRRRGGDLGVCGHVSLDRLNARGDLDLGCVVANERADLGAFVGELPHDLRPNVPVLPVRPWYTVD